MHIAFLIFFPPSSSKPAEVNEANVVLISQRRKWRQGSLSQLSNVNKLVAMKKEIGPRFPGFTILNHDRHQVHGGWENKEPTWNAMEALWYVFSGASGKGQHSKHHVSLPPLYIPAPPLPRLWMSLCTNAPESWVQPLGTIASDNGLPV